LRRSLIAPAPSLFDRDLIAQIMNTCATGAQAGMIFPALGARLRRRTTSSRSVRRASTSLVVRRRPSGGESVSRDFEPIELSITVTLHVKRPAVLFVTLMLTHVLSAALLAAPIPIVGARDIIIVDRSESKGSEIECLVVTDHRLWRSLSKLGQVNFLPGTCGFRIGDDFTAIVLPSRLGQPVSTFAACSASGRRARLARADTPIAAESARGESRVRDRAVAHRLHVPESPPGAIVCVIGGTHAATWATEMTTTTVALTHARDGLPSPAGFVERPVHMR
jgi:hypothetical protein